MKMASYIWDLDGTLLDSYPVIIAAAIKAAGDAGIHDSESEALRTAKQGMLSTYLKDVAERSGNRLNSCLKTTGNTPMPWMTGLR